MLHNPGVQKSFDKHTGVTPEAFKRQLELSGQTDFLNLPYHQAILNNQIPLSIGGGIGQLFSSSFFKRIPNKVKDSYLNVFLW